MSATSAPALNYLTVQDMLWLHYQLARRSEPFSYAKLEEATFYQYGYGKSHAIFPQAARFLTGFSKMDPFGSHASVTALLGVTAFLKINGYELNLPDAEAGSWLKRVLSGEIKAEEALDKLAHFGDQHGVPSVQEAMEAALAQYPSLVG